MKSKPDTYETEYSFDIKVEYQYFPPVWGQVQPGSGGLYLEPRPIGRLKITKVLSANGTEITNAFTQNQLEELEDEIAGDIDED